MSNAIGTRLLQGKKLLQVKANKHRDKNNDKCNSDMNMRQCARNHDGGLVIFR
jgi:hypothetical protein